MESFPYILPVYFFPTVTPYTSKAPAVDRFEPAEGLGLALAGVGSASGAQCQGVLSGGEWMAWMGTSWEGMEWMCFLLVHGVSVLWLVLCFFVVFFFQEAFVYIMKWVWFVWGLLEGDFVGSRKGLTCFNRMVFRCFGVFFKTCKVE